MANKISNERIPSKQDKKIVKELSDGSTAVEMASNASLKLGLTERQIYFEIQKLRTSYNCKTIPHLVATFLRAQIID